MKDYLNELIERDSNADPEFAQKWAQLQSRKALARMRRDRNLTQAAVAEKMGVPQSRVAEIEARPNRVSFVRMIAYAKAVGVPLEEIAEATSKII